MGLPDITDFLHNEIKYRTTRMADFWEPKVMPIVDALFSQKETPLSKFVDPIVDPQARPKIGGAAPQLPSEILEEGVTELAQPLLQGLPNLLETIGVDSRIAALGVPLVGLTITNPDRLAKGVKQGIATGPDFGQAMSKWNRRRAELIEQRRYPQGLTAGRRAKNRKRTLVTAYNDVSTGPTTDSLDVEAYGRSKYKVPNKPQHHLFPKQESYQFVERMKQIGDDDDVLNLFLYAEELDATMGGRLSNMLNMDRKPHNQLHSNRISDGRELRGMKMKNLVQSAKTTDELMDVFDQYIRENIAPSKAEARALQKAFTETRQQLSRFKSLSDADRRRL